MNLNECIRWVEEKKYITDKDDPMCKYFNDEKSIFVHNELLSELRKLNDRDVDITQIAEDSKCVLNVFKDQEGKILHLIRWDVFIAAIESALKGEK